ncbi:MAG: hypothetical protein HYT73_03760 [Candidatus Aenigmarchaeota archaeon]|nr:hypothetical protein [Candidatus Aenigmarchaeota archaeon]
MEYSEGWVRVFGRVLKYASEPERSHYRGVWNSLDEEGRMGLLGKILLWSPDGLDDFEVMQEGQAFYYKFPGNVYYMARPAIGFDYDGHRAEGLRIEGPVDRSNMEANELKFSRGRAICRDIESRFPVDYFDSDADGFTVVFKPAETAS